MLSFLFLALLTGSHRPVVDATGGTIVKVKYDAGSIARFLEYVGVLFSAMVVGR